MPSEPPTWRALFSTAEPTPALSRLTELIAAAVVGVIVRRHADPAEHHCGQQIPEVGVDAQQREDDERQADERSCRCRRAAAAPTLFTSLPACGAMNVIRSVIGRNIAPAWIGE